MEFYLEQNRSFLKDSKIWALGIAETLSWASLFYLFPALILRWEKYFGWTLAELSFGLTGALIIAAIGSLICGRIIDRGAGRILLTLSAFTGGLLILCLLAVTTLWQFYLIWLFLGAARAGCLYEPLFAVVTRIYQQDAKRPIIMITLMAGFAGTICFPISTIISQAANWQTAALFFSLLNCFVAAPLFWYGASNKQIEKNQTENTNTTNFFSIARILMTKPIFWFLAVGFGSFYLNHGMIISHILPLLESKAVTPEYAVIASSLIGAAQVNGRVILLFAERHVSMTFIGMCAFIGLSLAMIGLQYAGIYTLSLLFFVVIQGGSWGMLSIAKPIITADHLGRENFGTISSLVSIFQNFGLAIGPAVTGIIWVLAGYNLVMLVAFVLGIIGFISLGSALRISKATRAS
jgi:MFS family permease